MTQLLLDQLVEFRNNPGFRLLTAFFLAYIACWLTIEFQIDTQIKFVFSYFFPVYVAFFVYFFDRLEIVTDTKWYCGVIDVLILFFSILRVFYKVPYVSGHALFLSFALFSVSRPSNRVLIFIVWLQVLLLKLFLWHDITFYGGLLLGGIAAGLWYWCRKLDKNKR